MRTIPVIVDSHLRVDGNLLGHDLVEQIFDELTIPNPAHYAAKRMNRWGWKDIPKSFMPFDLDGDTVVMPRGYALEFKLAMRENDIRVRWIDNRKRDKGPPLRYNNILVPRDHQPEAVRKIALYQQGMYEAPTGSGKSLTVLQAIARIRPLKSLVIVDKIELLNQWIADFRNFFGDKIAGKIGQGKWEDDNRITVATIQTIYKRLKEGKIDQEWFDQFDFVAVDECHHITAISMQEVVSRFPACWRFGVSATPDREDGKFEMALNVLGDVFHSDDEEELRDSGVLIRPTIHAIKTTSRFNYWGDHEVEEDEACDVPKCKKIGTAHRHQNNYAKLKKHLVEDPERNALVAATVYAESEGRHVHAIFTNEIKHMRLIREMLDKFDDLPPIIELTGQMPKAKRAEAVQFIKESDDVIVIATIGKEGFDVPNMDRVYMPFPSSSIPIRKQLIGRATRVAEGKDEAHLFDFVDHLIPIRAKQFSKMAHQLYHQTGDVVL